MTGRLGVLLVGVKGAVATTTITGVLAATRGLVRPQGLVTGTDIGNDAPLTALEDLRFGGWDITPGTVRDATRAHGLVPDHLVDALDADLREVPTFQGIRHGVSPHVLGVAGVTEDAARRADLREEVEHVQAHIAAFRALHDLDRVVVVNVASTEVIAPADAPAWQGPDAFEAAVTTGDPRVTPAQLYAYAAIRSGCAFVEFTPSATVDTPAIQALSTRAGVPLAGKDGKTGQTAYKSLLADLFRMRDLRVHGWHSVNVLGNRDGAVLANADHQRAKVTSKGMGLSRVLGYADFTHSVRIDYYPPRGDWKEAWDVVDFEGWVGTRMTLRVNWVGQDSALAAPLVVDLTRLAGLALTRGEHGPLAHTAFFFKNPVGADVHALPAQYRLLAAYLDAARRDAADARRVPVNEHATLP